nr:C-type lectin BfL-2-like [Anolis sagrei ordinatus]
MTCPGSKSISVLGKHLVLRGEKEVVTRKAEQRRKGRRVLMGLDSSSYLSLLGLWVVFLFQPASAAPPSCPSGWLAHKKSCFGFFTIPMSWEEAEAECQKFGPSGHLASIHDQEETKLVGSYIFKNYRFGNNIWIGLQDDRASYTTHKRQFVWSDKSPVRHMSWGPAEPNADGEKEFCVGLMPVDGEEHFQNLVL